MTEANLEVLVKALKKITTICPEFKGDFERMIDFYKNQEIDSEVKSIEDFTQTEQIYSKKAISFSIWNDGGLDYYEYSDIIDFCYENNHMQDESDELSNLVYKKYDHLFSEKDRIFYVQNMRFNELSSLKAATRELIKLEIKERVLNDSEYKKNYKRILELIKLIKNEGNYQEFIETRI